MYSDIQIYRHVMNSFIHSFIHTNMWCQLFFSQTPHTFIHGNCFQAYYIWIVYHDIYICNCIVKMVTTIHFVICLLYGQPNEWPQIRIIYLNVDIILACHYDIVMFMVDRSMTEMASLFPLLYRFGLTHTHFDLR